MYTFVELAEKIKNELVKSEKLGFISADSIVIVQSSNAELTFPTFSNFLILIKPAEVGFVSIETRINHIFRYIYSISIDILEKRSADEFNTGEISKYDVLNRIIEILEHNTLENSVTVFPRLSVSNVSLFELTEGVDGISFMWQGYKDVYKN